MPNSSEKLAVYTGLLEKTKSGLKADDLDVKRDGTIGAKSRIKQGDNLMIYRAIMKKYGYLQKDQPFKAIPKKGTKEYDEIFGSIPEKGSPMYEALFAPKK
jgi:hypothetical protein